VPTDPRRPNNTWWIAPVLGVVVLTMAVGALVAHSIYHQPAVTAAPVVASTESSVPRKDEPGPSTVTFAPDVALYPQHTQVLAVLQTYFNSINDKDYDAYVSIATQASAAEQTKKQFTDNYATTRDGSIFVYRIDAAPHNGLRVMLSFVSTQALANAPTNLKSTCIQWQLVKPLAWDAATEQWQIDAGFATISPQSETC
jgi:hypothetical protein